MLSGSNHFIRHFITNESTQCQKDSSYGSRCQKSETRGSICGKSLAILSLHHSIYTYLDSKMTVAVKTFGKIETASAIFWDYLGMFIEYGQKNIFFRNNTFLFFKIESWNFQHLFEIEFRETSQSFNSFTQCYFYFFLLVVWLSWNFVRFHKI